MAVPNGINSLMVYEDGIDPDEQQYAPQAPGGHGALLSIPYPAFFFAQDIIAPLPRESSFLSFDILCGEANDTAHAGVEQILLFDTPTFFPGPVAVDDPDIKEIELTRLFGGIHVQLRADLPQSIIYPIVAITIFIRRCTTPPAYVMTGRANPPDATAASIASQWPDQGHLGQTGFTTTDVPSDWYCPIWKGMKRLGPGELQTLNYKNPQISHIDLSAGAGPAGVPPAGTAGGMTGGTGPSYPDSWATNNPGGAIGYFTNTELKLEPAYPDTDWQIDIHDHFVLRNRVSMPVDAGPPVVYDEHSDKIFLQMDMYRVNGTGGWDRIDATAFDIFFNLCFYFGTRSQINYFNS